MAQSVQEKEELNTKEQVNISDTTHTNNPQDEKITSNDIPIEEIIDKPISKHKYLPLIFTIIGVLFFVCIFSTIFALCNINSSKIVSGVSINGIDVSGLTQKEATQTLSNKFSEKLNSTLVLNYQDYKLELVPSQDFEANYNVDLAVEKAYKIGRSGNIFQNNYEIFASLIGSKKIAINLQYNLEKLSDYIDNISVEIPGLVQQPSYYIENESLIIVNGISGIELLKDETKNLIISNIDTLSTSNNIDLVIQNVEPEDIDISKIHAEIYSEPENAYVIKEPFEINVGSPGIDFAISYDEAKALLKEDKEEYVIPLKITPPEIGIEDLGDDIFAHTLGYYSSYYNVSNYNRTVNVQLASKKINNVILLPGEEFSYNKVVGERTFENGFKEASVYTSSGVVNGLGGGICQVSSTLYNSVLLANLEIVERRNHRYAVSYVPLGRDATVAYGSIDFRFKNNRKYPIKIVSFSQNGILNISILGIKEDVEYEVSITTKKLQTIPYTTKYINDSSLEEGTQKETQYGDYGYKFETYKTLKLDGNVVSSEKISADNYTPLTRVVRVGTKKAEVVTPPVESTPIQVEPNNTDSNTQNPEIQN